MAQNKITGAMIVIFFFLFFLELHLGPMEVPGIEIESELQLLA